MFLLARNGTSAWVGLPAREATKLQDLWSRDELGIELSVEVRAPVVVGLYPMRIARYVVDGGGNGATTPAAHRSNGQRADASPPATPGPRAAHSGAAMGPLGSPSADQAPHTGRHGP